MKKRKIILFGGSFDPVHNGHIAVVSAAADYIGADEVIFIPAKQSPHKANSPYASDEDRLQMVTLALSCDHRFRISECEIQRRGPSYTLDTIRFFNENYGSEAEFYWLAGADCLADLPNWYRISDLIDEFNLCIMYRGGFEPPKFGQLLGYFGEQRVKKLENNVIPTPLIDISSSDIRRLLAQNLPVEGKLPEAVLDYILKQGLYRRA